MSLLGGKTAHAYLKEINIHSLIGLLTMRWLVVYNLNNRQSRPWRAYAYIQ